MGSFSGPGFDSPQLHKNCKIRLPTNSRHDDHEKRASLSPQLHKNCKIRLPTISRHGDHEKRASSNRRFGLHENSEVFEFSSPQLHKTYNFDCRLLVGMATTRSVRRQTDASVCMKIQKSLNFHARNSTKINSAICSDLK